MANLDFFAVKPDFEQLFAFLFGETDFRVFESYSELGQELREYTSFAHLCSSYEVGQDRHGHGVAVLLQLWSPSVMRKLAIERIELDPKKCREFTFRFRIAGAGLVQLYLGGVHARIVTKSHYGHFSERGAARWGVASEADWGALSKLSGRAQRHIRRKLGVAKVPGRPVLAGAFELHRQGYELKEAAQSSSAYTAVAAGNT